jgi:FkbM family methyltransferase
MKFKESLKTIYRWLFRSKKSYSQTGEDIIAAFYLSSVRKGFYVDVGSNDPKYLNNTYLFYKMGWSGICVEPNRDRCRLIRTLRPRDCVIQAGIGKEIGTAMFYQFDPDTISTFSAAEAAEFEKLGHHLEKQLQVPIQPLSHIIEKNSKNRDIDLLSVDTEGFDMEVLQSNDWEKFRPKIVIVEIAEYRKDRLIRTDKQFDDFFASKQYVKLADTYINGIYISEEFARLTHII